MRLVVLDFNTDSVENQLLSVKEEAEKQLKKIEKINVIQSNPLWTQLKLNTPDKEELLLIRSLVDIVYSGFPLSSNGCLYDQKLNDTNHQLLPTRVEVWCLDNMNKKINGNSRLKKMRKQSTIWLYTEGAYSDDEKHQDKHYWEIYMAKPTLYPVNGTKVPNIALWSRMMEKVLCSKSENDIHKFLKCIDQQKTMLKIKHGIDVERLGSIERKEVENNSKLIK